MWLYPYQKVCSDGLVLWLVGGPLPIHLIVLLSGLLCQPLLCFSELAWRYGVGPLVPGWSHELCLGWGLCDSVPVLLA